MNYRFYAVRIFCFRWAEALAFYRDRIGLTPTFADDAMGWAEFDLGSARLALERCDPSDPESSALVGRFVGVSLTVDDIAATHALLQSRGVEFIAPPARQPWGGTLAHFKDPDGNVITLLGQAPSGP